MTNNADEFIGPTQARQRLRLASMSNPIVHAVDMAARRDGLSDVDRYALMAYHLLQSADAFQRLALEQAQRAAPVGVALPPALRPEGCRYPLCSCDVNGYAWEACYKAAVGVPEVRHDTIRKDTP